MLFGVMCCGVVWLYMYTTAHISSYIYAIYMMYMCCYWGGVELLLDVIGVVGVKLLIGRVGVSGVGLLDSLGVTVRDWDGLGLRTVERAELRWRWIDQLIKTSSAHLICRVESLFGSRQT